MGGGGRTQTTNPKTSLQNNNPKTINQSDTNLNIIQQSKQLPKSATHTPYHFHIITDGISHAIQTRLNTLKNTLCKSYPCEISIHTFDDSIFRGTKKWGQESQNYLANFRLFLGQVVPKNATKCLYLDTDMLALSDIRELFEVDLGECILGANTGVVGADWTNWRLKFERVSDGKKREFFVPYYFCSGLLLINMPKWHAYDMGAKCVDFIQNYHPGCPDQDALNVCVQDKLFVLPLEYGLAMWQSAMELAKPNSPLATQIQEHIKRVKIVHFNSPAHPWLSKYRFLGDEFLPFDYPLTDKWWEIALATPEFGKDLQEIYSKINDPKTMLDAYIEGVSQRMKHLQAQVDKIAYKQKKPLHYLAKKLVNSLRKRFKRV